MSENRRRLVRFSLLIALYLLIVYLIPKPDAVKPEGWRLFGLFVASIAGLVLEPIPGGAIVLLRRHNCTDSRWFDPCTVALRIWDPVVWLVMAAFFISRALMKTGLARRIALVFVRMFGSNSLGICYALSFSDMTLATIIPSAGARSGGVILPIARSIAELMALVRVPPRNSWAHS